MHIATNIEMDEATYEDDSLRAENEMPDEIPDFTTNTEGRGSKKRTQTASETWAHAKKPKLGEEVRRDRFGNNIWACSKCSWESGSLTSARNHLNHKHGIKIQAQQCVWTFCDKLYAKGRMPRMPHLVWKQ
ncbi:hypothetical protein V8E54_001528 [Elaphomyces granulatus]